MNRINMFLQKRKMKKSQHGLFMVITAYVISFLLLMIGSDTINNVKTASAYKNVDEYAVYEETNKNLELPNENKERTVLNTVNNLKNPYNILDKQQEKVETVLGSGETNWLLGYAMDTEEYNTFFDLLSSSGISEEVKKAEKTNDKKKEIEKKEVKKQEVEKQEVKKTSVQTSSIKSSGITGISKEEISMLERIVEAEASGEDTMGKILIVNVIFNRMKSKDFPNTIKSVIFQKNNGEYQFSPIEDNRYNKVTVSKETKLAVEKALNGEDYSKGALYFVAKKYARSSSVRWFDQKLKWLFKHGGHDFYKNK